MGNRRQLRTAPRRTLALVLAGGRGTRLKNLTDRRAKPAVYFGGKFRIIDFTLSNCINSGIRKIAVLTQYKSHSLLRHLQRGWNFLRGEIGEFVELWPAQQQIDETSWYKGTADAVFQNIEILESHGPEYILVLAGDHIYKMDYGSMLADHLAYQCDATVACIDVPRDQASAFGCVAVDEDDRIVSFVEKPADPPGLPGQPDRTFVSMGIYVFNAAHLLSILKEDAADPLSSHDFGKDIIPRLVRTGVVYAHRFETSCVLTRDKAGAEPYWRDVGTVDAYWEANIDLTRVEPDLDLYDPDWPIFTFQDQLPSAKFVHETGDRRGVAVNSLVSGGCIVSGATIRQSVLFSKVRVNSFALVEESVILPEVDVGRHARLKKVVVDRGCRIPEGLVIGEDSALDAERFFVTDNGVVLVTAAMLARLS